jgi:glycosyltransferase involved in cell wall biosynthesis
MHSTLNSVRPATGFSELTDPLVSVIIPYYKQERFIAETVRSVKQQTYQRFEIIVVDDGSPVPARSIIQDSSDVLVLRTENHGCPAARNFGFRQSSGKYLLFLDSDDLLTPGALEAHVAALSEHPAAALSFGAQRIIDEDGKVVRPPHICRPRKDYFLKLLEGNPIGCPGAAMIRRDAFIEAGLFDESLRIVEDYPLYLRLARRHPFVRQSSCVVDYRFHSNSLSQDKERMLNGILKALDQLEADVKLTARQRRRLRYGRRRWVHECRPSKTFAYRLRGLYHSVRAMLGVPLRTYFGFQDPKAHTNGGER